MTALRSIKEIDKSSSMENKAKAESTKPTFQSATDEQQCAKYNDMSVKKDELILTGSEEIKRKTKFQGETENLFNRLHLQDKIKQKLTPTDFLKICPLVKQDYVISEKDLAHTFLQRLMMLDYRARYIPVKQSDPVFDFVNTENNDMEALFGTGEDAVTPSHTHIHPMDVQMSVYHCSDSFLKQKIITKLSQCQYALPLLVPVSDDTEFPLWTFRQIIKTWKTQTKDTVTMKSMRIFKAETPMVSFFRLGSLLVSKSQLMNTLINDRHSIFFHRNCPGSTKSRLLMDGVAEIAWYCPAGKSNDAFTDCIAFSNLHGDALLFEQQYNILIEKSSINVVLVPTLEKSHQSSKLITALYKSSTPLIILIEDADFGAVQMTKGKYKIGLRNRNQSYVSDELKTIIGKILSGSHKTFQLETMAEVSGINVDENDKICQKVKSAAMKLGPLLQGMDVSDIKDTTFPCQGKLWNDWCKINKERYHLKEHIENEKCKKEQELIEIRQNQCKASCSELMKLFIESLSSLPSTDKEYFLKWTQILIDALSTDDLSSILHSYDVKWSEVLALRKKHDKSDLLKTKQTELEQISKKLQSTSFGLEHIFREMGQIYEAHKSLEKIPKKIQTDWSKYPELAAELMISGHPMELMDGDAGHVPLIWISSLFDEVIRKLGNQRVFVLSVLGVQSSGKSTMLNAMFGLQFAVSTGRCTRGAFMQLVKVSDEMKKDFQFDYVLVVDTEGLRALELEGNTTFHDNELATFVVGLGNMTLINIFGENSAEMQDVLQIVVQAFMRMKQVKLSPSCVFVHQNVTDVAVAERNMDGKRRLQEKLDQMVQLAAKEEVYDAECFSDIIAFDVQNDVKYFAQLWEGSPPMAPPNPGYSESVKELKNFIFSKASQSAGVTLSQFKSKIQDLWDALMNEHFVFSFKNTLEIAVYRKLEVQYGNWTWALRSNMLIIENQFYTKIENGKLDNVELSCLSIEINKTYEEIKTHMIKYFDDDNDKEMLVQWRGRFETKIKEFHDELVRGVKKKLDEVLQQRKACKKLNDKKTEFEKKLLTKSIELAHGLKEKTENEVEFENQFNSVWSDWVSELTADINPIEDLNLEKDQFTILREIGYEIKLIDDIKKQCTYKNMANVKEYSNYVSKFGLKLSSQDTLPYEEDDLIRSFINDVEKQSMKKVKNKPVATTGYSQTYLREVAKNVKEKVTEFESKRKYSLKKEFTVDLLLFVFDRAGSWFIESHKKFKMKNDPHVYLKSKKDHYYSIFTSFCKGASSAVVLGELVCEELKVSTVEFVCNKTAIDLAGEMRCSFPAFSGNRLNLEKYMLKSLAEKEKFSDFINYIQHPREHMESFIKEEVNKYIFTDHKDEALNILKKNVEDMRELVKRVLVTATEKVKNQRGDTDMWLENFSSLLKDKMTFDIICFQNFSDINDFELLKKEVEEGLDNIVTEMNNLSLEKMKDFSLQPDQILIDQLCRCCWVQCPFCRAVCTNTLENHDGDHSVPFHRSNAVNGWHYRGSVEMVVEFCSTRVASDKRFHPYPDSDKFVYFKKYRTAGPEFACWRITPEKSSLIYWKWFVAQFQTKLECKYHFKFQGRGEIPNMWKTYSKEEAIKSLDEMYNL